MKSVAINNPLPGKVIIQNYKDKEFPRQAKIKEFITTKPSLQEILKKFLQTEKAITINNKIKKNNLY